MNCPVHKLSKDKIIWLGSHKCIHEHTFLSHYNCYLKEKPDEMKIGFIDIETSNLDANYGIMLAYWIKTLGEEEYYGGHISPEDILRDNPDRNLLKKCIKDFKQFDLLYTYYGTKFDIPFIRTRALINKLGFPFFGSVKHKDVYYIIKNKFKLNRNGLETACRDLLGITRKSHFNGDVWRKALQGDLMSLSYISEHCKDDVRDLEDLTNVVLDFAYPVVKSI